MLFGFCYLCLGSDYYILVGSASADAANAQATSATPHRPSTNQAGQHEWCFHIWMMGVS